MPRAAVRIDYSDPSVFWGRVDRSGGSTACWPWSSKRRYGQVRMGGTSTQAHRHAWILTNGAIPDGMLALHKCDNPPCVNPAHLFLGTHLDNSLDRDRKGRGGHGRSVPWWIANEVRGWCASVEEEWAADYLVIGVSRFQGFKDGTIRPSLVEAQDIAHLAGVYIARSDNDQWLIIFTRTHPARIMKFTARNGGFAVPVFPETV